MLIATTPYGVALIIALMTLVTIATRWGGVFVMSFVPINDKVKRFIHAMSGSVLIALIAPMFLTGDIAARLALLATAAIMLLSKKPLLAIAAGLVVAGCTRQLGF